MCLWFVEVSEPQNLQLVLLSGLHIKYKWKYATWISEKSIFTYIYINTYICIYIDTHTSPSKGTVLKQRETPQQKCLKAFKLSKLEFISKREKCASSIKHSDQEQAITHLSQMCKESNTLYCFTQTHFICQDSIDALQKIHKSTPFTLLLFNPYRASQTAVTNFRASSPSATTLKHLIVS